MKYIALLRGINVGGNNKVAMAELKDCFEQAGFTSVRTYINSGNIIFDASQTDTIKLIKICEKIITDRFSLNISCTIISAKDLSNYLEHAPAWWDTDVTAKHNTLFVIPPAKASEIMSEVGDAKPGYEQVESYGSIIFWSAPIATFSRTRYSKIVSTKVYKSVTIRNANTTKKLAELSSE